MNAVRCFSWLALLASVIARRDSMAGIGCAVLFPQVGEADLAREFRKLRQAARGTALRTPQEVENARLIVVQASNHRGQSLFRLVEPQEVDGSPCRDQRGVGRQALLDGCCRLGA